MLELHDVHAVYGRSHVLHGVSLTARAGEVVSLLGRNGAGKSTTLKAVVGLVEVTRGSIVLDGRALRGLPIHAISRAGIGWVPEDRRIFGDLTVRENLMVGEARAGDPARRWPVERVFALFPRRLADRAYIIEKGEIKFAGPFAALDAQPDVRRTYLSVG